MHDLGDATQFIERMVGSTYYKTQRRYLNEFLEANKTHTTQSSNISVKVVLSDIIKLVEPSLDESRLHIPVECATKKACPFAGAFHKRFVANQSHVHTAITSYGLGECFIGLEGSFSFVAVRIGKIAGDLREQVVGFKQWNAKEMVPFARNHQYNWNPLHI